MTARVSLAQADPDLLRGIPEDDLTLAERVLTCPVYRIPAGRWAPELLAAHDNGGFALLVVDGVISRELDVAGRHVMEFFGSGDVLRPAAGDGFGGRLQWEATEPSAVVVLDERFRRASQRWPSLSSNLVERLLHQTDRAMLHTAILSLPRVESRVLAIFWQLAERWGRVTPAGVVLPLRLTHEAIGRLAGAQRPTVTLALRELCDDGSVSRGEDGAWILNPDSNEQWRERRPEREGRQRASARAARRQRDTA
jgi:CRP/FNR family transcriptional regulator, cyclic AMP receptor protein